MRRQRDTGGLVTSILSDAVPCPLTIRNRKMGTTEYPEHTEIQRSWRIPYFIFPVNDDVSVYSECSVVPHF